MDCPTRASLFLGTDLTDKQLSFAQNPPGSKESRRGTNLHSWLRLRRGLLSWTFVAIAAFLAVAFGALGFAEVGGVKMPWTTRFYLALQLLTMESGSLTDESRVGWTLEIARWSGAIAAFGTVLNTLAAVFADRLDGWFIRRLSGHAIVVGVGQTGSEIASGLMREGYCVVVLEADEDNPAMVSLAKRGAIVLHADARETRTLNAAGIGNAAVLVTVAGKDSTNLEVVAAVKEAFQHAGNATSTLSCYVHVADNHLSGLFDFQEDGPESRIRQASFDRFTNSARLTLSRFPLDGGGIAIEDSRQVHLVIVNCNELGEALLLHALAIGHYANSRPIKISVVDPKACRMRQQLLCRIPELEACGELQFIEGETSTANVRELLTAAFTDQGQVVTVAICDWDAVASMRQLVEVAGCSPPDNSRVLLHLGEDERALDSFSLETTFPFQLGTFGEVASACSIEAVLRESLDEIARKVHDHYGAKRVADGDNPEQFPAMRPWDQLSPEFREMNRQQADHIPVKLRAVGFRLATTDADAEVGRIELSEDEIEALAESEHARWCASRRLAGWRYGTTRDDKRKLHPDLIPWSELDEKTREYDRAPVRNLPKLLNAMGLRVEKCGS